MKPSFAQPEIYIIYLQALLLFLLKKIFIFNNFYLLL